MKRVDHIGIAVADLAVVDELLAGKLGLEKVREFTMPNGNRGAFYRLGDVEIELTEHNAELKPKRLEGAQARIDHIALEVDDLDGTVTSLAEMGIKGDLAKAVGGNSLRTDKDTTAGITLQFIQLPKK